MHISYEKLWKLLIERCLNKTDLISLCGISSRTLSKLSKNQNVNTDTLLSICGALGCDVGDIMEVCRESEAASLYSAFLMHNSTTTEDEIFKTYKFDYKGKKFIVKKTVKRAGKTVHIRCDGSKLLWVDAVPAGMVNVQFCERKIFDASHNRTENDVVYIVVISGKDMGFKNLDDGIYVSYNRTLPSPKHIYLMSETRFKMFEPSF